MSQNDFVIDNGTGFAVRQDIQNALQALAGLSSGNSAPAVKYAYQLWADTQEGILKIRNGANDDWIELLQLDGTFTLEDGSASTPGLAFRDDLNTGIFSSAADTFNVATGGTERTRIDSSGRIITGAVMTADTGTFYDDITVNNSNTASGAAGGAGLSLVSGGSSFGGVIFSNNSSHGRGYMKYDMSNDRLIFGTQTLDRLMIEDAGNNGDVHIITGDIVMDTAGKGINFSATANSINSASSDSEVLTDYEKGTFTPTNTVGLTLTNNNPAYYIKIGHLVHIQMDVSFTGANDASQCGFIQSLPFTSENVSNHFAQGSIQHVSESGNFNYDETQNDLLMFIGPNESRVDIVNMPGGGVAIRSSLVNRRMRISMCYKATA